MHITDKIIYPFLKILVSVIFFVFTEIALVFVLLRRATDIHIFLFESKRITNQIKIYKYFSALHACAH